MRKMLWLAGAVLMSVLPMMAQRPGGDPWSYGRGGPGNWDNSWNGRPNPRAGACFYTNQNFGGNHFCVRAGDRLPKLPGNFGDNISSIQVFGRARVQVFDDRDYRGPNYVFRNSVADLRQMPSRPGIRGITGFPRWRCGRGWGALVPLPSPSEVFSGLNSPE